MYHLPHGMYLTSSQSRRIAHHVSIQNQTSKSLLFCHVLFLDGGGWYSYAQTRFDGQIYTASAFGTHSEFFWQAGDLHSID
jgi:hypothetical protein